MTEAFGMSHLLASPKSTLTPSPHTFSHGLHCSHTEVLFPQTDDILFHLQPPLLGQPHTPWWDWLLLFFKTSCGCNFLQEVFPIPNTGLVSAWGSSKLPMLTDTTTLLLWHTLVHLPHQNVNSPRTGPVSFLLLDVLGAEDGNYSINVCSMGEWNTQQMFSLQVKQREGNLPYQYLRKNQNKERQIFYI